jgi:hypothetical protein
MAPHKRPIVAVCATNDEAVLAANLLRSEPIRANRVTLELVRGASSASGAFAGLRSRFPDHILVFVHQDVLLPKGWDVRLRDQLSILPSSWAVAGVCGIGMDNRVHAHVWSTGLQRVLGGPLEPSTCLSLDEVLLVLRTETGVDFDPQMPGFHLYGTDLVLTALRDGFDAFCLDMPILHNSRSVAHLDAGYRAAYRYIANKWKTELPLQTCVVDVRASLLPVHRFNARMFLRGRWRRHQPPSVDPVLLSQELGFDNYQRRIPK